MVGHPKASPVILLAIKAPPRTHDDSNPEEDGLTRLPAQCILDCSSHLSSCKCNWADDVAPILLVFVCVLVPRRLCCGNLHRQAQPSQRLISIALAFCPCEFTSITDNHANLYFSIWHLLASVGVGLCRTFYTPPTDWLHRHRATSTIYITATAQFDSMIAWLASIS